MLPGAASDERKLAGKDQSQYNKVIKKLAKAYQAEEAVSVVHNKSHPSIAKRLQKKLEQERIEMLVTTK